MTVTVRLSPSARDIARATGAVGGQRTEEDETVRDAAGKTPVGNSAGGASGLLALFLASHPISSPIPPIQAKACHCGTSKPSPRSPHSTPCPPVKPFFPPRAIDPLP